MKNEALLDKTQPEAEPLEAIAIIGMAGRFPGANNIEEFWHNLRDGIESVSHFSDEELLALGHDPVLLNQPNYVKAKGIIDGVDHFDANFFGFSPREAEVMDPQHRLFLESAWTALEHAGYDASGYNGRIGIFAGVGANSYLLHNLLSNGGPGAMSDVFQLSISNDKDFVPTRAAYLLNLTGPSIAVNTGCSSGLVAVSLAVQSLLSYQCDMMLAGGVSLSFPHKTGYLYQPGMVASPDGRCRAFDAQAQGAVGGEGVGIVVLKRLEDALADGDTIHAVIRGCAINNDGANKVGFTAPGVDGQASVIAEALAMADVPPATIAYVEAHGSGTTLGDPIEVAALKMAFQADAAVGATAPTHYCAIGSVKTNIGHADTAAGVAGLIKTVQALKHGQIPPSLHYTQPNPQIDFANSPFYVNDRLRPWPENATPRRAGVSSFGIGGTNAHVVLEEAPLQAASSPGRAVQLLPLAAKTPTALALAAANLADHLQAHPALPLADVAYTQSNRRPFAHRCAVIADHRAAAIAGLRQIAAVTAQEDPRIAFLFPAEEQGAERGYGQMGRALYDCEPLFRTAVDHCVRLLLAHHQVDLRHFFTGAGDATPAVGQPLLFVFEYALAQLWLAWGMQPVAVMGCGVGDYVAACLAGLFTLEETLALVTAHSRATNATLTNGTAAAAVDELARCVAQLSPNAPQLPYLSGATGMWMRAADVTDATAWVRQRPTTAQAAAGLPTLGMAADLLVVVGPAGALATLAQNHPELTHTTVVTTLPAIDNADAVAAHLTTTLGRLWEQGAPVDWCAYYGAESRHRLPLPTYPFERQSYWVAPRFAPRTANDAPSPAPDTPKQHRPDLAVAYAPPQTPVEAWLATIWQKHLGIAPIGRDDDFFQHLAGQSLSAMGLLNRVQEKLGATMPIGMIFEAPTIGQMASYLQLYYADGLAQLRLVKTDAQAAATSTAVPSTGELTPDALLEHLDELSEAELDAALAVLMEEEA